MNLGFENAVNTTQSSCVVFHDVDVVPVDDRNSYVCGAQPRHLAANINNARYVNSGNCHLRYLSFAATHTHRVCIYVHLALPSKFKENP